MHYKIEGKDLVGGSMPTIYFNNITLSVSEDTSRGDAASPHVKNRRKSTSVSSRRHPSGLSGAMKVELDLSFCLSSLRDLQNLGADSKYCKIMVVQCLKKDTHDEIKQNPFRYITNLISNVSDRDFEAGSLKTKIISVDSLRSFSNKTTKKPNYSFITDTNRESFYKIPAKCSFNIQESEGGVNCSFLSYLTFCFFDYKQAQIDSGIYNRPSLLSRGFMVPGKISVEKVIERSKVVKSSIAFVDNRGIFWTSQVHQMKDGSWMKHSYHSRGRNQDPLRKMVVHNTKVRDHRMMNILESISYGPFSRQDYKIKDSSTIDKLRKDNNLDLIKKGESFFSDFYITRDMNNRGRFIFSVNMESLLKANTDFTRVLENMKVMDISSYYNIVDRVKIKDLVITRKRIKNSTQLTSMIELLKTDDEQESVMIARGADVSTTPGARGSFVARPSSASRNSPGNASVQSKFFGTMEEMTLHSPSESPEIRHFGGLDSDVSRQGVGKYSYSIDLEIENPMISFVTSISNSLDGLIEGSNMNPGFQEYYRDSESNDIYYDDSSGQFNRTFISFYNKKYNFNKNLVFASAGILAKIYFIFSEDLRKKQIKISDVLHYLVNISSPSTGSPDGINKVLQLMLGTSKKLKEIINKHTPHARYRDDKQNTARAGSSSVASSAAKRNNKMSHNFKQVLDLATPRNIGYDYLSAKKNEDPNGPSPSSGLTRINRKVLQERFDIETKKYFSDNSSNITIKNKQGDVFNRGDALETNKYTYLTVSNIYLAKEDETISFSNINSSLKQDLVEESNDVLTKVFLYNKGKNVFLGEKGDATEDKTSRNLVESLSVYSGASVNHSRELRRSRSQNSKTSFPISAQGSRVDAGENLFIEENSSASTKNSKIKKALTLIDRMSSREFSSDVNSINFYFINDDKGGMSFKNELISERDDIKKPTSRSRNNSQPIDPLVNAPNQLKALLLSMQKSKSVNSKRIFDDIGQDIASSKDVLRNPDNGGVLYYSYKNMREVQVFRGYKGMNMKDPIWSPMKKEDFANMGSSKNLWCRHIPYKNITYGINQDSDLTLPTYDEYFVASGQNMSGDSTLNARGQSVIKTPATPQAYTSRKSAISRISNTFFNLRRKTTDPSMKDDSFVMRSEFISTDVIIKKIPIPQSITSQEANARSIDEFITNTDAASISKMKSRIASKGLGKLINNFEASTHETNTSGGGGGSNY